MSAKSVHEGEHAGQRASVVRAAYDTIADAYADHFPTTEPEQAVDLAMVAHFASLVGEPRTVLDAGCGAGRFFPVLAGLGCQVEGVDLSEGMVRRAQRDHPQVRSSVASLAALPYANGALGGIFSWYSTIHAPEGTVRTMLTEARRALRADGVLLVAFQTGEGSADLRPIYRRHGFDVELVRYNRTADVMSALVQDNGFDEVARLDRAAAPHESTGQAVIVARRGS